MGGDSEPDSRRECLPGAGFVYPYVLMKSLSSRRALTLALAACLLLPVACGDDDDDTTGPTAGTGGSALAGAAGEPISDDRGGTDAGLGGGGGSTSMMLPPGLSTMPSTTTCGADSCSSAKAATVYVDPCCTDTDSCGLDTGFLSLVGAKFTETCQAHDQPGTPDATCPDASGLMVPVQSQMLTLDPLVGCCREDGNCGVVVDKVTVGGVIPIGDFGLGCIEGAPFFGKTIKCGELGAGGAGGAGGQTGGAGGGATGGAGGSP